MDAGLQKAIEALHSSPLRASISTTGAGGQVIGWLLAVPGASNTVLEATVPYAYTSLDEHLKRVHSDTAGGACNADTAKLMAQSSFMRSENLAAAEAARGQDTIGWELAGVGCTAAIVSVEPKKGAHRCHIGVVSNEGMIVYSLTLNKGKRDRIGEDALVSRLLLLALCETAGVKNAQELVCPASVLFEGEKIIRA